MNLKQGMVLAGAVLAVTGCGGSSSSKGGGEPFVEFRVNGVLNPTEISVSRLHIEGQNLAGSDLWDPCNPEFYKNGADIALNYASFCANEISLTGVSFSVKYYSNAYDTVLVGMTGIGYTVHLYEYDAGKPDFIGKEVWSSDYAVQQYYVKLRALGDEVEDFDPQNYVTEEVAPGGYSLPSDPNLSTLTFDGFQNFNDSALNVDEKAVYDPAGLAVEPAIDACDWISVDYEPLEGEIDPPKYQKVVCRGINVLPLPSEDHALIDAGGDAEELVYVARVEFNFDGWNDQPNDIVIRVNLAGE